MAKKSTKPKACGCLDQLNEQLRSRNARVVRSVMFSLDPVGVSMSGAKIELEKINPKLRTKLPNVYSSYCPFCGKPYSQGTK